MGSYLVVSPPDVQDVPLSDRPVEGQAWHSIAKGERVLIVGDPSDINRHLQERRQAYDHRSPAAERAPQSPRALTVSFVPWDMCPILPLPGWAQCRCRRGG